LGRKATGRVRKQWSTALDRDVISLLDILTRRLAKKKYQVIEEAVKDYAEERGIILGKG
jgi:predicted transcriptional regulator